ncbi:MAG: S4 domain-containing protein, partial [Legionellales bacterium]
MTPENHTVRQVVINSEKAGQRIDNFLLTFLKGVPRSHVYRILRSGEVRVNKKRIKPDYRLQTDDILRIPPVRQAAEVIKVLPSTAISKLAQAIIYEDENLLVLNKPTGMAVHGGSGVSFGVIEALRQGNPQQT